MGSVNTNLTDDFVILGPTLAPGNNVLEAIHSLYYLPENYKLIFTGDVPSNKKFYSQVQALVERDGLGDRVRFVTGVADTDAVILPHVHKTRARRSVTGDSPEALASAILSVARATA